MMNLKMKCKMPIQINVHWYILLTHTYYEDVLKHSVIPNFPTKKRLN